MLCNHVASLQSARLAKEREGLCQGILKVPVDQAITKLSPLLTDFKENEDSQSARPHLLRKVLIPVQRTRELRVNILYE